MEHVFVDGCGIGAGLHHNGKNFYFKVELDEFISTNDTECLALILGMRYIIHHKLKEVVLYSDSQISCNIMKKGHSPQPHLNKKSKTFNHLLKIAEKQGLNVNLQWIPGSANLADKPSRAKGDWTDGWDELFSY